MKPHKGSALLFWSLRLDGSTDQSSMHAGCPVVRGTKWTATKWMRQGAYPAYPGTPVGGEKKAEEEGVGVGVGASTLSAEAADGTAMKAAQQEEEEPQEERRRRGSSSR